MRNIPAQESPGKTMLRMMPNAMLMLALASATIPTTASAQQDADPVADSLIALWIDSVGGMETYHRFHSASFAVTTYLFDTASTRLKRARPRYVWIKKGPHGEETRVERWEDYGFVVQGFDGRGTWATVNGQVIPDSAKDAREALYVARDLFYWMGLPFKLRDPGVHVRYLGLEERPGAAWDRDAGGGGPSLHARVGEPTAYVAADGRYHAVGVSFAEGVGEHSDVFTYYFAPGRGFPLEVTYVEEGKTALDRLVWGTTERVGNLRYPYVTRRDWITASGKRTKALVVWDVQINPEIPQPLFELP